MAGDCPIVGVGGALPNVERAAQLSLTVHHSVAARHIETTDGELVDCAVTTCSIAVVGGDGVYPYYYTVVSTPITFSP
jgi:hypothetical protein